MNNTYVVLLVVLGVLALGLGSSMVLPERADEEPPSRVVEVPLETTTTVPLQMGHGNSTDHEETTNSEPSDETTVTYRITTVYVTRETTTEGTPRDVPGPNSTERPSASPFDGIGIPSWLPSLLFVLFVGAAAAYLRGLDSSGDEGSPDEIDHGDDQDDESDDEGEPAEDLGTAADHVDATDHVRATDAFENEVFRAWSTFVDRVGGVDRDTATPGEIERAAIEAGDPPDAVRTLTATFNDVRYGSVDPDEHRAATVAALRSIAEAEAEDAASDDGRAAAEDDSSDHRDDEGTGGGAAHEPDNGGRTDADEREGEAEEEDEQ